MVLFIKLFRESFSFALTSMVANKLRTLLTLLGITIGIFAIITVFTIVDAMETKIKTSIESLGDNVIFVQKWPWAFGGDYPWWKYMNRPVPQLKEVHEILKRTPAVDAAVFMASASTSAEYLSRNIENIAVLGVSEDYNKVRTFEMEDGRYFSPQEMASGRSVVIIGHEIASKLFFDTNPVGKTIKIFGRKVIVSGVFKKEGDSTFGNNHDELIVTPILFAQGLFDINSESSNPNIMARARAGVSNEQLKDELTGVMRSIRRLKPAAEDNFALNESSLLSKGFEGLFNVLSFAGWLIGGFSILVGGFGIANIMFVSVKERTTIIGIQKALGARNYFILLQFLFEAVLLSLFGGLIGLLIVFAGTTIASNALGFELPLTIGNILTGINVSVIIGLVSGFIPAYLASKLDPVEAIRANT